MKVKSIFYCIAGSGLGNASRFQAIEQMLGEYAFIYVFCWGKSHAYLKKKYDDRPGVEVVQLHSFKLPLEREGLGTFTTFINIPKFLITFILNTIILIKHIIHIRPHFSVHDSDYHYLPFFLMRVPRIIISQAPMIVHNRQELSVSNLRTRINFYLYEYSEYILTLIFGRAILCPSFDPCFKSTNTKIIVINPIVRREFCSSWPNQVKPLAVLTGGSGIDRGRLQLIAAKQQIDFFAPQNGQHYHSILDTGQPLLSLYKGAIIQAGHVLISECLSLGVMIYPVAIKNHPEQFVNVKILEKISKSSYLNESDDIHSFILKCNTDTTRLSKHLCDGASQAAQYLVTLLDECRHYENNR